MSSFHRFYGHIPPYSHPSSFSQVPETFPRRNCLPIPGSFICDFKSVLCFYKPDGDCGRTYLISGAQHSLVLRRLAYPSSVPGVSPVRPVTVKGNHYKPRFNTKSSEIRPSSFSGLQFLGMKCPTHLGIVRVLEESQQNSSSVFFRVLQVQFITAREFLSMLGSLNAAADFHLGRFHMRPLQLHLLANRKPHRDSWIYLFQCPIRVVHQSIWWMNPTIYLTRIPLVIPSPDFYLFSDASRSGWGAHLEPLDLEVQDLWECASQDLHINNLEIRAVFLALQRFQNHIYDSCVMVASDNSSEVAYLKKQGGTHSSSLCTLVWELLYWCHHRYSHSSRKFPGKLNVSGQSVSSRPNSPYRMVSGSGDCLQIFKLWGTPQVDLFATRLNHHLALFLQYRITGPVQWMLCP